MAAGPAASQRWLWWTLVSESIDEFSKARTDLLAAALAFHTLLSIAPLIIVAVAVAGVVLGEGQALDEVTHLLQQSLGRQGAVTVRQWVEQASDASELASVVGAVLTVWTASHLGSELRDILNQLWGIDVVTAAGFRASIQHYLRRRAFALLVVALAGPLLLVVFTSRALLTVFHEGLFARSAWHGFAIHALQVAFSLSIVAVTSAVVFRYVPDKRVRWKNAAVGGALTSAMFNAGNVLVGLYLGRASVTAAYGAAGSLVVVLLWLYFSAQMFLLGAQFTLVYGRRFDPNLRLPRAAS